MEETGDTIPKYQPMRSFMAPDQALTQKTILLAPIMHFTRQIVPSL